MVATSELLGRCNSDEASEQLPSDWPAYLPSERSSGKGSARWAEYLASIQVPHAHILAGVFVVDQKMQGAVGSGKTVVTVMDVRLCTTE